MRFKRVSTSILLAVSSLMVVGCGQAPAKKQGAAGGADRMVFASLDDCIDSKRLEADVCDRIVENAIKQHERTAKKYRTIEACEKGEGADRCERTATNEFMPRPVAFLVTFGKNASAQPMYAGAKGANVFRHASGTVGPEGDVPMSERAKDRLEDLKPSRRRS